MKKLVNKKFIAYVCFAILTSIINVSVYLLVYKYIYKNIIFSNILAYVVSISFSFFLNKKIVFKNNSKRILKQIILYLSVKFISFGIDSLVLVICKEILNINNFWSKIIANCSTTLSNYTLNNRTVFKDSN